MVICAICLGVQAQTTTTSSTTTSSTTKSTTKKQEVAVTKEAEKEPKKD